MRLNDDTFPQWGPSMADAAPGALVEGDGMSARDPSECIDLLTSVLAAATVAARTDRRLTRRCLQRAAALLRLDLDAAVDVTADPVCAKGALAVWQIKRVQTYIEDNLDSRIRSADLACVVRLSLSHFQRAFRKALGATPMAYVMRLRIHRAQDLMLNSRMALSQIALACGMCDQAQLTRAFRRVVGACPTIWRRQFLNDVSSNRNILRHRAFLSHEVSE